MIRTHCVICGRFIADDTTHCSECAILDYLDEPTRVRDEDDGQTYGDPRDERDERRDW